MATIEPFYSELGRRVQTARNNLGMTQEELGRSLQPPMTRASIANIEAGKQRVMVHTLAQLADRLTLALSELVPTEKGREQHFPANVKAELHQKLDLPEPKIRRLAARLNQHGGKRG